MKFRDKKPVTLDLDHMKVLHLEAIDQLELMQSALEAAEDSTGTMRDVLDQMALNHWHAYMDIIHMMALHDDALAAVMTKFGMKMRHDAPDEEDERQIGARRTLLLLLLFALIRRHRRFDRVFSYRASPMGDYLKESLTMERQHVAQLMAMVQSTI
jgi:hypothetical protein